MVMSVPPSALPVVGEIAVTTIFATYRNAPVAVTFVAELMLMTLMSTGPVTVPDPFGVVELALGEITTNWLNVGAVARCASAEPKKT